MSKILITGRGGSGKTTIHELLLSKGHNSFDADDVPSLARWEDKNGQPIDVDYTGFVDYSKVSWNWGRKVLTEVLSQAEEVIICGSATNQLDYYDLFDTVLILTLDEPTHKQRLMDRSSKYGKEGKTMEWILQDQDKLVDASLKLGAIPIDASSTPEETVAQIERYL